MFFCSQAPMLTAGPPLQGATCKYSVGGRVWACCTRIGGCAWSTAVTNTLMMRSFGMENAVIAFQVAHRQCRFRLALREPSTLALRDVWTFWQSYLVCFIH